METQRIIHPFGPLYSEHSRVLILGSFPSVKSREQMFFYGHPQNRFWRILAALYDAPVPKSIEEKTRLILDHGLALWDVIAACDIVGSADAAVRNAVPTDLTRITAHAPIRKVLCNGALSGRMYQRYQLALTGIPAVTMPSTSPANAAWSLERLIGAWSVLHR